MSDPMARYIQKYGSADSTAGAQTNPMDRYIAKYGQGIAAPVATAPAEDDEPGFMAKLRAGAVDVAKGLGETVFGGVSEEAKANQYSQSGARRFGSPGLETTKSNEELEREGTTQPSVFGKVSRAAVGRLPEVARDIVKIPFEEALTPGIKKETVENPLSRSGARRFGTGDLDQVQTNEQRGVTNTTPGELIKGVVTAPYHSGKAYVEAKTPEEAGRAAADFAVSVTPFLMLGAYGLRRAKPPDNTPPGGGTPVAPPPEGTPPAGPQMGQLNVNINVPTRPGAVVPTAEEISAKSTKGAEGIKQTHKEATNAGVRRMLLWEKMTPEQRAQVAPELPATDHALSWKELPNSSKKILRDIWPSNKPAASGTELDQGATPEAPSPTPPPPTAGDAGIPSGGQAPSGEAAFRRGATMPEEIRPIGEPKDIPDPFVEGGTFKLEADGSYTRMAPDGTKGSNFSYGSLQDYFKSKGVDLPGEPTGRPEPLPEATRREIEQAPPDEPPNLLLDVLKNMSRGEEITPLQQIMVDIFNRSRESMGYPELKPGKVIESLAYKDLGNPITHEEAHELYNGLDPAGRAVEFGFSAYWETLTDAQKNLVMDMMDAAKEEKASLRNEIGGGTERMGEDARIQGVAPRGTPHPSGTQHADPVVPGGFFRLDTDGNYTRVSASGVEGQRWTPADLSNFVNEFSRRFRENTERMEAIDAEIDKAVDEHEANPTPETAKRLDELVEEAQHLIRQSQEIHAAMQPPTEPPPGPPKAKRNYAAEIRKKHQQIQQLGREMRELEEPTPGQEALMNELWTQIDRLMYEQKEEFLNSDAAKKSKLHLREFDGDIPHDITDPILKDMNTVRLLNKLAEWDARRIDPISVRDDLLDQLAEHIPREKLREYLDKIRGGPGGVMRYGVDDLLAMAWERGRPEVARQLESAQEVLRWIDGMVTGERIGNPPKFEESLLRKVPGLEDIENMLNEFMSGEEIDPFEASTIKSHINSAIEELTKQLESYQSVAGVEQDLRPGSKYGAGVEHPRSPSNIADPEVQAEIQRMMDEPSPEDAAAIDQLLGETQGREARERAVAEQETSAESASLSALEAQMEMLENQRKALLDEIMPEEDSRYQPTPEQRDKMTDILDRREALSKEIYKAYARTPEVRASGLDVEGFGYANRPFNLQDPILKDPKTVEILNKLAKWERKANQPKPKATTDAEYFERAARQNAERDAIIKELADHVDRDKLYEYLNKIPRDENTIWGGGVDDWLHAAWREGAPDIVKKLDAAKEFLRFLNDKKNGVEEGMYMIDPELLGQTEGMSGIIEALENLDEDSFAAAMKTGEIEKLADDLQRKVDALAELAGPEAEFTPGTKYGDELPPEEGGAPAAQGEPPPTTPTRTTDEQIIAVIDDLKARIAREAQSENRIPGLAEDLAKRLKHAEDMLSTPRQTSPPSSEPRAPSVESAQDLPHSQGTGGVAGGEGAEPKPKGKGGYAKMPRMSLEELEADLAKLEADVAGEKISKADAAIVRKKIKRAIADNKREAKGKKTQSPTEALDAADDLNEKRFEKGKITQEAYAAELNRIAEERMKLHKTGTTNVPKTEAVDPSKVTVDVPDPSNIRSVAKAAQEQGIVLDPKGFAKRMKDNLGPVELPELEARLAELVSRKSGVVGDKVAEKMYSKRISEVMDEIAKKAPDQLHAFPSRESVEQTIDAIKDLFKRRKAVHDKTPEEMSPAEREISQHVITEPEMTQPLGLMKTFTKKWAQLANSEVGFTMAATRIFGKGSSDAMKLKILSEMSTAPLTWAEGVVRGEGPMLPTPDGHNWYATGNKSIQDIVQSVGGESQVGTLGRVWASLNAIELHGRGKNAGIPLEAANIFIREVDPKFIAAAMELRKTALDVAQWGVWSGLLTPEALNKFSDQLFYAPIRRLLTHEGAGESLTSAGQGKKLLSPSGNPLKRLKGSNYPQVNPIETLIDNTYRTIRAAHQNYRVAELVRGAKVNPELGKGTLEPASFQAQKALQKLMAKKAEDLVAQSKVDGVEMTTDEAMNVIKMLSDDNLNITDNQMTVWVDGKPEVWRLSDELAYSIKNMNNQEFHMFTRIAGHVANVVHGNIVADPFFIVRQMVLDNWQAYINSNYGFNPLKGDQLKGWLHLVNKTPMGLEYIRASGGFSGYTSSRFRTARTSLADAVRPKTSGPMSEAVQQIKELHPFQAWKTLVAPIEEAARVSEYVRARGAGKSMLESIYAAKRITINYSRMGGEMRAASHMVPFLNAFVQSTAQAAENFAAKPARYTARAAISLALPAFILWWMNKDDKEIQDYRMAAGGERYFWLRGPDSTIYKMRKSYLEGAIFATGMEAAMDKAYKQNPQAFEDWGRAIGRELGFNFITPMGYVPISLWTGKDLRTQIPIVPEQVKDVDPELQYGPYSGSASRIIGEKTKIAPSQIQYVIDNVGGATRLIMKGVDAAIDYRRTGAMPRPQDIPGMSSFVARNPSLTTRSMQELYSESERLKKVAGTIEYYSSHDPKKLEIYNEEHKVDLQLMDVYKHAREELAATRGAIEMVREMPPSNITADEKAKMIDNLMRQMVGRARMTADVAKHIKEQGAKALTQ